MIDALEELVEHTYDSLVHWMDQHGVDVEDRRDARLQLRMNAVFDDMNEAIDALTAGLYAWMKAGWKREDFESAQATFEIDGQRQQRVVDNLLH